MTEMLPIIRNIYVGIIGLILSSSAQSLTCDDLNGASIYSQEYTPTYLGFFGNQYASESIYYELGTYGSELSQLSVRNTFGSYGSESWQYSATNSFTTTPPTIYKNNVLLGFLTTNSTIIGGISLDLIDSSCSFTATAAANAPAPLTGLMSSSSSTSISLSWNVSQGATAYNVYQCESSSCSASELLGSVSSTVANINSLQASQTYYFAVQPSNNSSYGDVGYITAATLADSVAPVISGNVVSSINEGATALGSVTADETVTWSISGSGVSISSSGVITLDTAADYETAASYSFTITATDSNGNATSTSTLTVSVVDADENAPVITTSNVVSSINEGATALGSVTADETVTWSISGSGVSISSSGVITLDTAADYETAASYSFTITATDSNGNSVAVVIDMVVVQDSLISDSDNDGIDDASDAFPNNALYSVDSDSDGMPDAWESRYGLDPNDASDSVSDQDNDGVLALDEFLAGTIPAGSLDLDGNGQYDALTDGLLLLRGMFLLSGDSLISDAVAFDAVYKTSDEVASRIDMLGDLVDIDGNGSVDALTDGLVILRYLFNLRGDVLINDVIASDATVKTAEDVEAKIESLMPAT
ncbi:cadherin repeat domain-containing protein [Porticoccaceae bacterium]|nr:cadherin repeat domain-containing protein [Porticoccaceae bacterium]